MFLAMFDPGKEMAVANFFLAIFVYLLSQFLCYLSREEIKQKQIGISLWQHLTHGLKLVMKPI